MPPSNKYLKNMESILVRILQKNKLIGILYTIQIIVNKYYRAEYAMTWNLTLVVMGGAGNSLYKFYILK